MSREKLEADDVYQRALADPSSMIQLWIDEAKRLEAEHAERQSQAAATGSQFGFVGGRGRGRGGGLAGPAPLPRALPGSTPTNMMFAAGVAPEGTPLPASEVGFFGMGGLNRAGLTAPARAGRFAVKFQGGQWVLIDRDNADHFVNLPAIVSEGQGFWELTPSDNMGNVQLSQGDGTSLCPIAVMGYPAPTVQGMQESVRIPESSDEEMEETTFEPEQEQAADPTAPQIIWNNTVGQWFVLDPVSVGQGGLSPNPANDYFFNQHPSTQEYIIDSRSQATPPQYLFKVLGYKRAKTRP